jgi:hypothetical protein
MPEEDQSSQVFDFFYAVMVFQLGVVLVLARIVFMRYTDEGYMESVALTVMGFGVALFVLASPLEPDARIRRAAHLLLRVPAFRGHAVRAVDAAHRGALRDRARRRPLPRGGAARDRSAAVDAGGHWHSPTARATSARRGPHSTRFTYHGLELVFHTGIELSPALFLHMRLLAQVVGEFYEGKRPRERAAPATRTSRPVHETGARLTHDVKNLLQSLYALTSLGARGAGRRLRGPAATPAARARQAPARDAGEAALAGDRHQRAAAARARMVGAAGAAPGGPEIALEAQITADGNVPASLFDSFIENTLENARAKRLHEPAAPSHRFQFEAQSSELSVCDTGARSRAGRPAPDARADRARQRPGIGLFNLARQASQAGYVGEPFGEPRRRGVLHARAGRGRASGGQG